MVLLKTMDKILYESQRQVGSSQTFNILINLMNIFWEKVNKYKFFFTGPYFILYDLLRRGSNSFWHSSCFARWRPGIWTIPGTRYGIIIQKILRHEKYFIETNYIQQYQLLKKQCLSSLGCLHCQTVNMSQLQETAKTLFDIRKSFFSSDTPKSINVRKTETLEKGGIYTQMRIEMYQSESKAELPLCFWRLYSEKCQTKSSSPQLALHKTLMTLKER